MPEMYLRQHGFMQSTCGPFTKSKTRIQKFKATGDLICIYIHRNKLDKACFQYYIAYGDFKNLPRRTTSDKVLRDKAFEIASNAKYEYKCGLASVVSKIFVIRRLNIQLLTQEQERYLCDNQELANELHKPITRKSQWHKIYSS